MDREPGAFREKFETWEVADLRNELLENGKPLPGDPEVAIKIREFFKDHGYGVDPKAVYELAGVADTIPIEELKKRLENLVHEN